MRATFAFLCLTTLLAAPAHAMEGLDPAAMSQVSEFKKQLGDLKKPGPGDMGKVQKLLKLAMAMKAGNGKLTPEDLKMLRSSLAEIMGNASDPTYAQLLGQLDMALARFEAQVEEAGGDYELPEL